MQSFRTEIENPVVEKDIIELERKIRLFKEGKIDEERFRSLRLARGVYGQRQPGVQMVRIKLPYGKMSVNQLRRICDVSDEYSTGNLHITTRQDIQIHYVSLDRTPELWAQLEKDQVTLREACGNTVRNVTASPMAGIDPAEPFDVTPYADTFFNYFLRNPICQEMGRKFKVSFSSSDEDTAFAFMHDLGFIPKVKKDENGNDIRGFKIMIAGGLGAQPIHAQLAYDFLPANEIIPFAEAVLRIFDRYGERQKRFKARFKFLMKQKGLEEIFRLIEEERKGLPSRQYEIDLSQEEKVVLPHDTELPHVEIDNEDAYNTWYQSNVFAQKQKGFCAVALKIHLGDLSTEKARLLADIVEKVAGDDMRLTVNQGLILRYVKEQHLSYLYKMLVELNLADPGFDSTMDVTACPGTDTCNLGISSSTGISKALENIMREEYPELVHNKSLKIKISGCMNACGQHTIAGIGFHGSTIKVKNHVAPALQVLLGGGILGNGKGVFAEKVIKIPSKRGLDAFRWIMDDYESQQNEGEYFHDYFRRQGKKYFYELLKKLGDTDNIKPEEFIDWGHEDTFQPEIGVGECASVIIDLVATLIYETKEKVENAEEAFHQGQWADSIYHSYTTFVNGAKALLVSQDVKTNTQASIIKDFDVHFVQKGLISFSGSSFAEFVYRMRKEAPTEVFATTYLADAQQFYQQISVLRAQQVTS